MTSGRSWLASRHLQARDDGRSALGAFEKLAPAARDEILAAGDRLSALSVNLAHQFFVAAVPAHTLLAERYPPWRATADRLLEVDGGGRDATHAFYALDPTAFMDWSEPVRETWLETIAELAGASKRLAAEMVAASSGPLERGQAPSVEQLQAWRRALTATVAAGGWRAEFTAGALVGSTAVLLALLDEEAIAAWTTIVAAAASSGRSPKVPTVPAGLARLDPGLRSLTVRATGQMAERRPTAAGTLLERLTDAAGRLAPQHAQALLESAATSSGDPEATASAVLAFAAAAHALPEDAVAGLLVHGARVADEVPGAFPAYLRTAQRAYEEGGAEGVALWVGRGIAIAAEAEQAAVPHFQLETRTAHKVLVDHTAAVAFEEVEPLLQRYVVMMARRSFQLIPSVAVWFRPPLADPDDPALRLPERIDLLPSSEDNRLFYKLGVAHVAGRWEYGTYDFDLSELEARGWTLPASDGEQDDRRDIVGFVERFPNPLLASALFVLLEGARVDACLARDFPGLRPEIARLAARYVALAPPAASDRPGDLLIEALFVMTLTGAEADALEPRLRAQGRLLGSTVELLKAGEASVYTSAQLTLAYYGSLALAHAVAGEEGADPGAIGMGGATVVDPFEHLDDEEAPPAGAITAPGEAETVEAEPIDAELELRLEEGDEDRPGGSRALSAEELRELLERGADLKITEEQGEIAGSTGLYATDLLGKLPGAAAEELHRKVAEGDEDAVRRWLRQQSGSTDYLYDEWDHTIDDYRRAWCRLSELEVDGDHGRFFADVLSNQNELVQNLRREFQLVQPDQFRKVRGMQDGEDFDLNAVVEAHADRMTKQTPSERLYVARRREERDVATLFLVDMSASTDEPLAADEQSGDDGEPLRVIDLAKQSLALMASVLDEVGDAYAIYGFSGHGRDSVEYYHVKSFTERLSDPVRSRLGGIEPKRSTRMGTALRHSAAKLARVSARSRHLILLSDGFPQDFDYGEDRRSNVYGIRDTMRALAELEADGVSTFCITVDPAGHDYLRDMCPQSAYAVLEDVEELPREVPRIYRQITRL